VRPALGLLFVLGMAAPARADVAQLRSRIAAMQESAERAGVTPLLEQASRALLEAERLRTTVRDEVAGDRAEAIAEAAVRAAERRIEAHRARTDRDAARARLAELEERARLARQALEQARAERSRLEAVRPTAPTPEPAPEGE
jgi:hypothetical protein